MHVVYQPLWRIVLHHVHSLFIDRELVLSYSFKVILIQNGWKYQKTKEKYNNSYEILLFKLGVLNPNWFNYDLNQCKSILINANLSSLYIYSYAM